MNSENNGDYLGLGGELSLTINAAFLNEIKEDNVHFNHLIKSIAQALDVEATIRPRVLSELLTRLRDEMETHFALEEFFGYFDSAVLINPQVSRQAESLKGEHESLYIELNGLVEESDRIVYQEKPCGRSVDEIVKGFFEFYERFQLHEQKEMELVLRLVNEEIGVGD